VRENRLAARVAVGARAFRRSTPSNLHEAGELGVILGIHFC
jgi:hypothetical protein